MRELVTGPRRCVLGGPGPWQASSCTFWILVSKKGVGHVPASLCRRCQLLFLHKIGHTRPLSVPAARSTGPGVAMVGGFASPPPRTSFAAPGGRTGYLTVRHREANRLFSDLHGYEKDRLVIRGSGAAGRLTLRAIRTLTGGGAAYPHSLRSLRSAFGRGFRRPRSGDPRGTLLAFGLLGCCDGRCFQCKGVPATPRQAKLDPTDLGPRRQDRREDRNEQPQHNTRTWRSLYGPIDQHIYFSSIYPGIVATVFSSIRLY